MLCWLLAPFAAGAAARATTPADDPSTATGWRITLDHTTADSE